MKIFNKIHVINKLEMEKDCNTTMRKKSTLNSFIFSIFFSKIVILMM